MTRHLLVALFLVTATPALEGGRYLVICDDDFAPALAPLVEWKTRKGAAARVVPLPEAGATPAAVRDYIRDAWANWPVRPEFVLLACSPARLPGNGYEDDCFYGDMEGDYRMEIPVGRFPAATARECSTMVNRTLRYELAPDSVDTLWLTRASTVVCEETPPDQYYQADSRLARSYWQQHGYTLAESLANFRGHTAYHVAAALNQGRAIITYRGLAGGFWTDPFWEFHPYGYPWVNGSRTPLFVSATCATVTVAPGEDMLGNLAMRRGAPDSLHGALAFFGTTRLASNCSRQRSTCYRGFFDAVYGDSILCLGAATVRARNRVDSLFHDEFWYTEWCLLGDPELNLWTARPRDIEVEHDTLVANCEAALPVTVRRGGTPVTGAVVCLWMDSTVYVVDTTDAQGRVEPALGAAHPGRMKITVTGPNLRPYLGSCRLTHGDGPWVGYLGHTIADTFPLGNADEWPGPGETVRVPVRLFNFGDSASLGTAASASTPDSFVRLLDTLLAIGDLGPGESLATAPAGFLFEVDSSCPDGHELLMTLTCRDSSGRAWRSDIPLRIGAPLPAFIDTVFEDPGGNRNGRLDPRETCAVVVRIHNRGWGEGVDARLELISYNPWLEVLEPVSVLGRVPGKSVVDNSSDPLVVRAAHFLPGEVMPCSLVLTAVGKRWAWPLNITVGAIDTCDPAPDGPRQPALYWAYDDLDRGYPQAPVFAWVEINGVGTRLELTNDSTAVIELPPGFGPFYWYGQEFRQLSVSDNGWLAPGSTRAANRTNFRLPWNNPLPVLAPNWTDLRPDLGGSVWWHHDPTGHRVIVQWDSLPYVPPFDSLCDRFQAILYDTTRSGPDGNCEVEFQYASARFLSLSTTGVQDPSGQVGITCKHRSIYNRAASAILPGRAIRFTTSAPPVGIAVGHQAPKAGRAPTAIRVFPTITHGAARLALPWSGPVSVTTYDAGGRSRVTRAAVADPDRSVDWLPVDKAGRRLPPGTYFIRVTGNADSATCRVVLAR